MFKNDHDRFLSRNLPTVLFVVPSSETSRSSKEVSSSSLETLTASSSVVTFRFDCSCRGPRDPLRRIASAIVCTISWIALYKIIVSRMMKSITSGSQFASAIPITLFSLLPATAISSCFGSTMKITSEASAFPLTPLILSQFVESLVYQVLCSFLGRAESFPDFSISSGSLQSFDSFFIVVKFVKRLPSQRVVYVKSRISSLLPVRSAEPVSFSAANKRNCQFSELNFAYS